MPDTGTRPTSMLGTSLSTSAKAIFWLVRDKGTGKSRGFEFLAFEDQRSTNLDVDNLNGAFLLGRTIKVDHVADYKRKIEEDEEELQRKREKKGVCRAFQCVECNRGASCKFSHDEKRCADTGYVPKDGHKWGHDKYEDKRDPNSSSCRNYEDQSERHVSDRNGNKHRERDRSERDQYEDRKIPSMKDDEDISQSHGNNRDEAPQIQERHESRRRPESATDEARHTIDKRDLKHYRT